VSPGSSDPAVRIARAERVERLLLRLGWVVVIAGVVAIAAEVVAMAMGHDDPLDGVVVIGGVVLGLVLAGAVALGAAVNVGLNLERLRRDMARDPRD
jgi:hypothetical protein